MMVGLPLAVSPFAYLTLGVSIALFVVAVLWVIRPGGLSLLMRLMPWELKLAKARRLLAAGNWQAAFSEANQLRDASRRDKRFGQRLNLFEGDCLYRAAEKALEEGKHSEALELMRGAGDRLGLPESAFDSRVVEVLLAEIRRRLASAPASADITDLVHEVLRLTRNCPEASFWLGLHHLHAGRTEEARASLFQAASADRSVPDPSLYFGALQLRTENKQDAVLWLERAEGLARDNPIIQWQLGTALVESDIDPNRAVRHLEKALSPQGLPKFVAEPGKVWVQTMPGKSWLSALTRRTRVPCPLRLDDFADAVTAARRSLALALEKSDRSTDAAAIYYQAYQAGDQSVAVRRGLGLGLARAGMYDDAKPHLEATRELEGTPSALTAGYLALCIARATTNHPSAQAHQLAKGLDLLTSVSVRRDVEWARVTRDLFGDAWALNVTITPAQRREIAEVFASVNATDELAVEAYDLAAEATDQLSFAVAAGYVRAVVERGARSAHDAALFDRAFRERDALRQLFSQQRSAFTAAERLYLKRWAAGHAGRYPDAPGTIYPAIAERGLVEESRRLAADGKNEAAREVINLAFHLGPTRALTLDRLAEMAYRRGDKREALVHLSQWMVHHPHDYRPLLRQAVIDRAEGRVDEALDLLTQSCEKVTGAAKTKLLVLAARTAVAAGKFGQAAELLERSRDPQNADPTTTVALAALAWQRGDYERLAALAPELEALRGGDGLRSLLAALAHAVAGDDAQANEALQQAEADPAVATEVALLRSTLLSGQGRDAEAKEVLAAVSPTPMTADLIHAYRGQAAWKLGDYAEAAHFWNEVTGPKREAWGIEPLRPFAALLAAARLINDDPHEALRLCQRAAASGGNFPRLTAVETQALRQVVQQGSAAGDAGDTLARVEGSLRASGLTPTKIAWLARGYRRQNLLDDARRLLDAVEQPDLNVALQRGLLSLAENRPSQAESEFAAALEIDPHSAAAAIDLALVGLSLGRVDGLSASLERAADLSASPDFKKFLVLMRSLLPGASDDPALAALDANDELRLLKRLQRIGRLETVAPMVERLAQNRIDSSAVKQARAEVLVLTARRKIDLGDAESVLQMEPHETVVGGRALRNLMGVAACLCGQFGKGLKYFQASLPPRGDDARVQQNLALAAMRQSDRGRAKAHWGRYLAAAASHCPAPTGDPTYVDRLLERVRQVSGIQAPAEVAAS